MSLRYAKKNYINPGFFVDKLTHYGEKINVNRQMDVDEFFINFLDGLEETLKVKNNHHFLELLFNGELFQEIVGIECKHKTTRKDNFLSLPLPVKGMRTIENSFRNFIQWERLEGDNAFFCQTCNKKTPAKKRISIFHLPNFLILNFKRFEFEMDTGWVKKEKEEVE